MSVRFTRKLDLIRATKHGDFPSVSKLLEEYAVNPNVANNDGETPLILAARHGHYDILKALLSKGADVSLKDTNGWSPLLWACNCGRMDIVRILLSRSDVVVDDTSKNGATPLMWASKSNHVDVVNALMKKGADVFKTDQHGSTAIMYACHEGHLRVVHELLKAYQKPELLNRGNSTGTTPLMWACKSGRQDIVECLISKGADVNNVDGDGEDALMRAARAGHENIVEVLIKSNANIKAQCDKKKTALMLASAHGHGIIITTLLEHGAEVNQADEEGYTPLMFASKEGHFDAVKTLITYGADLKAENLSGQTALDLAKGNKEIADKLQAVEVGRSVGIGRQLMYDNVIHPSANTPITPREFPMEYITFCTNNFNKARKKGEGSFGVVYYAQDPMDETIEFVVKRSKIDQLSEKDLKTLRDGFEKEIKLLTKCRHSNIVRLYGQSINQRAGREQLCLLYEYCENGNLSDLLSNESSRRNLPVFRRIRIMYEIARAINFLHKGGVSEGKARYSFFHRDVKSSNICLTSDYTAKLIDCGLSKFVIDQERINEPGSQLMSLRYFTQSMTIVGTPGYICPQFAQTGIFIDKCDVYSFGVVMLELITGISQESKSSDRSISTEMLVSHIGNIGRDLKKLHNDVDPIVLRGFNEFGNGKLFDLMELALACVEVTIPPRPTMDDVVKKLSLLMDSISGIVPDDSGCGTDPIPISINETPTSPPTSPNKVTLGSKSSSFNEDESLRCGLCTEKVGSKNAIECPNRHCFDRKCIEFEIVKHIAQPGKEANFCCPICIAAIEVSRLAPYIRLEYFALFNRSSEEDRKNRALYQMLEEMRVKVSETQTSQIRQARILEAMMEDRKKDKVLLEQMNEKLKRYGDALTELASGKKSPCPRLIIVEPIAVQARKKVLSVFMQKKYNLYFVCEHSFTKVEPPLTFNVSQKWIRNVAPFILIGIRILPLALGIPIPTEIFQSILAGLSGFVDPQFLNTIEGIASKESTLPFGGDSNGMMGVVPKHLDATARGQIWENSARTLTSYNAMTPKNIAVVDSAYEALAELANKDENKKIWKQKMSLVMNEHGHFIWVIKDFACLYDDRESELPDSP